MVKVECIMPVNNDYIFATKDAQTLMGAVGLPDWARKEILNHYVKEGDINDLINLFSQFIGMANSVVENCRDSLELFCIVEKDYGPYQAEKINLPTIFGALQGIHLAENIDQNKTCHGCACRIGSLANQSPTTTCDVDYCLSGGTYGENEDKFMCHEDMENDKPTKLCRGYAQILKNRKRQVTTL